jgi:hypothetical protein
VELRRYRHVLALADHASFRKETPKMRIQQRLEDCGIKLLKLGEQV